MPDSAIHAPAEAIALLYRAFATVPRPVRIEGCPHCVDDEDTQALLAPVAVRELPADTLRGYAVGAMQTTCAPTYATGRRS